MAQHTEPQKGQRNAFREEDSAEERRHKGEGISHASDNEILKGSGTLDEWATTFKRSEVSLSDKLVWQNEDLGDCEYEQAGMEGLHADSLNEGRAPRSHVAVRIKPTCMSNWGVRKIRKTRQSR